MLPALTRATVGWQMLLIGMLLIVAAGVTASGVILFKKDVDG